MSTPCENRGYKVGDKFLLDEKFVDNHKDEIVKLSSCVPVVVVLAEDDDTSAPWFRVYSGAAYYDPGSYADPHYGQLYVNLKYVTKIEEGGPDWAHDLDNPLDGLESEPEPKPDVMDITKRFFG